jgi:ribokinase
MAKIVVVGDFNVDLVLYLERLPREGETLNADRFFEGPGGKGSNQAVASARLGADVTFFGAIGKDQYGELALDTWRSAGVRTNAVMQKEEYRSGVAMIYVDREGHNMIAVSQGSNLAISQEDLGIVEAAIADADLLMCTLGVPLHVVERALSIAKQSGTRTVLNTAPAAQLSPSLIEAADYLSPNETELSVILGEEVSGDNLIEASRRLITRDDQTLIVTLGGEGARWVTREDTELVPAFEVEAIDTVGAGDAFNAGFSVALAEGRTRTEAVRFAAAAAAISVTRNGAVASLPMREECEEFLSRIGSHKS